MAMAFSWNFSFLLDGSGKILDVQGNCVQAFGATGQEMIGRSLLPHIAPAERAHFRRFLAQLDSPSAIRQSILHIRSGLRTNHACLLQASVGSEPGTYHINLTDQAVELAEAGKLADLPAPIPRVTVDELEQLIEMAISELPDHQVPPLDLTVIEIGGLIDHTAIADKDESLPGHLQQRIEQSLIVDAFDDVVCLIDEGIYVLLHEEAEPVADIAADLHRAAQDLGISDKLLDLKQRTVKLGVRPSRARLRALVDEALLLRAGAGRNITTPTRRFAPLLWSGVAAALVMLVAVGLMFMV
ncbi:PAS domain-containing protein [Dongia soli]|uniref:PAS domain-containing protein n=1 Tax=Dongia soli TaxID=600628 RepID=A0ABU5EHM4_9PROT|nr:PAS domain-containing protein [Dongia soli]MDY0884943.1 PAS domain-containing protein [Dongia soli]